LQSGGRLAHERPARNVIDVAAANADVTEIVVRELGQLTHCSTISAPSVQLLRNRFQGKSFSYSSSVLPAVRLLHCEMMPSRRKR
jgi:hypothetical protein